MIDEIMLETEEHMEKAISGLKVAFGGVRTGSANPMLLDRIKFIAIIKRGSFFHDQRVGRDMFRSQGNDLL